MSATGAGYDYSVSTFSPNGRVFQVEYAAKAVEKSGTAIGIKTKDGVVLAVEKQVISPMMISASNRRIHTIDLHAGLTLSGMAADARQIAVKGREEARNFKAFYGEQIPGDVLAQRLASHVHMHTLYWYLRPFGCAVLLATFDERGPGLYAIEPSGVHYKYFGVAIGKNKQAASSELEQLKFNEIDSRTAVKELARILTKLHDESKDKQLEIEISWVCEESGRKHQLVPEVLRQEALAHAAEIKRREEMDEDEV